MPMLSLSHRTTAPAMATEPWEKERTAESKHPRQRDTVAIVTPRLCSHCAQTAMTNLHWLHWNQSWFQVAVLNSWVAPEEYPVVDVRSLKSPSFMVWIGRFTLHEI